MGEDSITQEATAPTVEELQAEMRRLTKEFNAAKDQTVRAGFSRQIEKLQGQVLKAKAKETTLDLPEVEVVDGETKPPSPEQLAAAENLIRQARVEKMRGNAQRSTELLHQAVAAAPGSVPVLEALGDSLMEGGRPADARQAYEQAHKLDPKNISLERKYGLAVLKASGSRTGGSIDGQLHGDSALLNPDDAVAGGWASIGLTLIFPGLGHIVLGRTTQGIAILAGWILSSVWLTFMIEDLKKLGIFAIGGHAHPNMLVLVPMMLNVAIFIVALVTLRNPRAESARKTIERPRPPVDLPFE